jgi:hypothetical protein
MTDFESNYFKLIEKFENYIGLVNATMLQNARIAKKEGSQYHRNLLEQAVKNGIAWRNGELYTHNKYGIYFHKDVEEVVLERTFDPSVLNNPNIIDLPPRRLKNVLNTKEIETWNANKESWTCVYQLLCGVQIEGKIKININLLPKWYYPSFINAVSTKAEKLIVIYKILKIGWSEFKEYFSSEKVYGWSELKEYILSTGEDGYNDIFQIILYAKSIYNYNTTTINLIDRKYIQLNYLRELLDNRNDRDGSEYHKAFRNFLGINYDVYIQICNDLIGVLGGDSFINDIFSCTQNSEIKELLVKLNRLGEDSNALFMKSHRRETDKDRSMKYKKKNLAHYLKTLQPDSIEFFSDPSTHRNTLK